MSSCWRGCLHILHGSDGRHELGARPGQAVPDPHSSPTDVSLSGPGGDRGWGVRARGGKPGLGLEAGCSTGRGEDEEREEGEEEEEEEEEKEDKIE